ncbi:MAG TPA: hypothetical protein PLK12_09960 [Prolixibacteraceae bacterium]|nr:hypothetical protein [Prolixibacteraceae bacterium]
MSRIFVLLFTLLLFTACEPQAVSLPATWTVLESEPANNLFAPGMELCFAGNKLTAGISANKAEYRYVWIDDKLAVRSTFSDWLFKTEAGAGDTLYLYEQYAGHPMKIKLVKINKSKKNRS